VNRTIQAKYWCGDVVFLRVNEEHKPGMVTQVRIAGSGSVTYEVTWRGNTVTCNYESELSTEFVPDYGVSGAISEAAQ